MAAKDEVIAINRQAAQIAKLRDELQNELSKPDLYSVIAQLQRAVGRLAAERDKLQEMINEK